MGRSLARLLAERGESLCIVGRDEEDLKKSATDLEVRGRSKVSYAVCDLEKPETFDGALDAADKALGGFDTFIITAGLFGTQEQLEKDEALLARVLHVDFTATV